MFHTKSSQAAHVRRMMEAKLQGDKVSPSFVLPSNHPKASKETTELKVKEVPMTTFKFGGLRSESSDGFDGNVRQKFGFSGRKCSSNVHPTALTYKCYSKDIPAKQNNLPDRQERSEAAKDSEKDYDSGINSSDQILPSPSKFTTLNSKKKMSIFSNNSVTTTKGINCENFQKETITKAIGILKPTELNVSTWIISPNHSSRERSLKTFLQKDGTETIFDSVSIEEIGKGENSDNLQEKEADYSITDAGTQGNAKNQLTVSSGFPRKKSSSSIKTSEEASSKVQNLVPGKEVEEIQVPANVKSFKTVSRVESKTKSNYHGIKIRNSKKFSGPVMEEDVLMKTSKDSFSKNTESPMRNSLFSIFSHSSSPKMSLDSSLNDQKTTLELKGIKNTRLEEVQCLSKEMAPGKSKKPVKPSILKTRPFQTTALVKSNKSLKITPILKTKHPKVSAQAKQRQPSRIPLTKSRIEMKKITQKENTSLDSLEKLIQYLGTRNDVLSIGKVQSSPRICPESTLVRQVDSESFKEARPNDFSAKDIPRQNAKKQSCQSLKTKEKKSSSGKMLNPFENRKPTSSDMQYDTADDLKDPESMCFSNVTLNANADMTVSTWLTDLPVKNDITFEDKNNGKIGGSFCEDSVGEDSDLKETSSSIGEKMNGKIGRCFGEESDFKGTSRSTTKKENLKIGGSFGEISVGEDFDFKGISSSIGKNENGNIGAGFGEESDFKGISRSTTKKENLKIDGSFGEVSVGEDSDLKGTRSSPGKECKKKTLKSLKKRQSHKLSTEKLTDKPYYDTDSYSSLPLSSGIKDQIKNRKTVINTDKLLGKFDDSFSDIQFLESPIQKFMDEINSAVGDFESDE